MGIFSKAKRIVKKPRKLIKKLIPKEIRPFVPYIAAATPGLQGYAAGVFANPAAQKALIAGLTRFATDDEADLKDVGITSALAATPDLISSGSEALATKLDPRLLPTTNPNMEVGKLAADTAKGLRSIKKGVEGAGTLKTIGAQTAVDATAKLAEIQ